MNTVTCSSVDAPEVPGSTNLSKKGISGSTIKLIAITAMLIDHIAATVLERLIMRSGYLFASYSEESLSAWMDEHLLLYTGYFVMRMIGRFGFPIFCFLLVEGFQHTHNRVKYAFRLFLFALISEIPFDFAFRGKWFYSGYQNVFFTLLIGLLALCVFSYIEKHLKAGVLEILGYAGCLFFTGCYAPEALSTLILTLLDPFVELRLSSGEFLLLFGMLSALVMAVILFFLFRKKGRAAARVFCADVCVLCVAAYAADLLLTDYGGMGVITIALMYAFRKSRTKSMLAGCISLTVMSFSELPAFLMLIPISKYNGKRGLSLKYVFYAFYPVHLGLLYLLCVFMGIA